MPKTSEAGRPQQPPKTPDDVVTFVNSDGVFVKPAEMSDSDLDEQIAYQAERAERAQRRANLFRSTLFPVTIVTSATSFFILQRQGLSDVSADFVAVTILVYVVSLILFYAVVFGTTNRLSRERQALISLNSARRLRRQLQPAEFGAPVPYFDRLVNINVSNLDAYYTLVKFHTSNSFQASIAAGGVGFALIVAAVGVSLFRKQDPVLPAAITAGAGVITEFIAAIFFYLYNSTVRQLKEYHDSLLSVQNVLLSFKIVGDTSDSEERTKMVSQMLAYLVGDGARDRVSHLHGPARTGNGSVAGLAELESTRGN